MSVALVVTQPFGGHGVGSRITDPEAVAAALESNPSHVVKVAQQDEAPAEPEAAPESRPARRRTS